MELNSVTLGRGEEADTNVLGQECWKKGQKFGQELKKVERKEEEDTWEKMQCEKQKRPIYRIDTGKEESLTYKKCVSGLKLVKTSFWMELKDFVVFATLYTR